MKFISEKIIDKTIDVIQQEDPDMYIVELSEHQPSLIQFIASENFKLLREEEFDTLIFLLSVIWKAVDSETDVDEIDAQAIEENDEKNWSVVNELGNKNFSKVLDHYFDNYSQEDLLAFVEDTLAGEEADISQVGKELLLITCKTFIDSLDQL